MSVKLYNTLTREKAEFRPIDPTNVRMYVCGPTVYDYAHIGNARPVIVFDVLFRLLRHVYGAEHVTYARNITDVDDKINARALRDHPGLPLNEAIRLVTEKTETQFHEDVRALGCLEPSVEPRATDNIPQMIEIIEQLVANGHAYVAGGEVLFDTRSMADYGQLSKRPLDEQQAGARIAVDAHKKNPGDFVLWKLSSESEPGWESPWGRGRPGWHIECSAMSGRYLGEVFDIHGGGLDLIFPHHENELAQSEAASGHVLANYWMHCGFLDLEGAKMSKSLGNGITLRDALGRMDPEALRYFLIGTHYRNPLSFSDKSLSDAELRMEYFYETLRRVDARLATAKEPGPGPVLDEPHRFRTAFEAAMDDDFNTSGGLAALSGLFAALNELLDHPPVKDKAQVVRTLRLLREDVRAISGALGLLEDAPESWLLRRRDRAVAERGIDAAQVEALLAARAQARVEKDWSRADAVRDELAALGVELMDTAGGTSWRVASPDAP